MLVARLARRGVVELVGPDSAALLQGVVTNDVRELGVGSAQACAFLNPKGRMLAEAILHRPSHESILVDVDATLAPRIVKLLQTARLRKKVDIADASQRIAVWAAFGSADDAVSAIAANNTDAKTNTLSCVRDPRWKRLGARILDAANSDKMPGMLVGRSALATEEAYERWRTLGGIPQGLEVDGAIPLELNQDALHAVSFNKGCYTGQELTARTHFQGLVRKRIVPILVGTPAFNNADIKDAEAELLGHDVARLPVFKPEQMPVQVIRHDNSQEPAGKIIAVAHNSGIALALMRTDNQDTETWTASNAFKLVDNTPLKAAPWPDYWQAISKHDNEASR